MKTITVGNNTAKPDNLFIYVISILRKSAGMEILLLRLFRALFGQEIRSMFGSLTDFDLFAGV